MIKHPNIRAFVAIPLDEEMRKKMSSLVKELKQLPKADKLCWVPSPNLHLTLHFFGQFPVEKLAEFGLNLSAQLRSVNPFKIDFEKIMVLPNEHHPHALALQVRLNEPLALLYREVQLAIEKSELTPESRPFLPHLTIGRIRGHFSLRQEVKFVAGQLVDRVYFYQSRSNEEGPVYEILETFYLGF